MKRGPDKQKMKDERGTVAEQSPYFLERRSLAGCRISCKQVFLRQKQIKIKKNMKTKQKLKKY